MEPQQIEDILKKIEKIERVLKIYKQYINALDNYNYLQLNIKLK